MMNLGRPPVHIHSVSASTDNMAALKCEVDSP